jgi:hypothetical protein
MGAPVKGMQAAESATAEALLGSLKSLGATERRKHATVLNYWLSIRKNRDLPPIRDLDPLEISDAGPFSVLLELIGGGEDAEIRHIGQSVKGGVDVTRVTEAPEDSLLGCIAKKLPIVAISRNVLAFEDEFAGTQCSVTLLPFSSNRTWVDYVYGYISLDGAAKDSGKAEHASQAEAEAEALAAPEPIEEVAEAPVAEPEPEAVELTEPEPEVAEVDPEPEPIAVEPEPEPAAPAPEKRPGFSKIFDALAGVGFYGTNHKMDPALPAAVDEELEPVIEDEHVAQIEPEPEAVELTEPEPEVAEVEAEPEPEVVPEPAPVLEEALEPDTAVMPEPEAEPEPRTAAEHKPEQSMNAMEGPLQNKLTEVRAKADEARAAKLRANAALYDGLSAAYDFALDAEEHAEEYLKLVEAQGLKIQLRSPMAPVVKLAFNGMCDDATIGQLESVLAWALKNDLPRGSLAERIESEGGIGPILGGQAKAA